MENKDIEKGENTEKNDTVLIDDFETGKKTVVKASKVSCYSFCDQYSAHFFIAAFVSIGTLIFAVIMLIITQGSGPLTPFYSSLVSGTISYWFTPPQKKQSNGSTA